MKQLDVRRAAREANAPSETRPATAILHDTPDTRLIVFRLSPGQSVAPHRNASTVVLTVISGEGFVRGGDEEVAVAEGQTVIFEPDELHGMRADTVGCVLLATIAPRPGSRARPADPGSAAATAE